MNIYYFGCWDRPGHYLWDQYGNSVQCGMYKPKPTPFTMLELDGGLWSTEKRKKQEEGEAILCYREGWTILSFWDRSGDERHGSISAVVTEGNYGFEEMEALLWGWFPGIAKRLHCPLRLYRCIGTPIVEGADISSPSAP